MVGRFRLRTGPALLVDRNPAPLVPPIALNPPRIRRAHRSPLGGCAASSGPSWRRPMAVARIASDADLDRGLGIVVRDRASPRRQGSAKAYDMIFGIPGSKPSAASIHFATL